MMHEIVSSDTNAVVLSSLACSYPLRFYKICSTAFCIAPSTLSSTIVHILFIFLLHGVCESVSFLGFVLSGFWYSFGLASIS